MQLINNNGDITGHGRLGTSTVIWESQSTKKCQLELVTTLMMETVDQKTFYNHKHMVQLWRNGEFYDPNCKIKIYKTDLTDIYMTEPTRTLRYKLQKINPSAVDIASHYDTQLHFLSAEISRTLRKSYSISTSP